jgi:hypothetical protein
MTTYRVQQGATVYYEVTVQASNEDEALELGMNKIMSGEGVEVDGSFEWQDDTWVEENQEEEENE